MIEGHFANEDHQIQESPNNRCYFAIICIFLLLFSVGSHCVFSTRNNCCELFVSDNVNLRSVYIIHKHERTVYCIIPQRNSRRKICDAKKKKTSEMWPLPYFLLNN